MLNHKHMSILINRVLSDMGVHEPVIEKLIRGTLLHRSGFKDLFETGHIGGNPEHGMFKMNERRLSRLLETIRYNPRLKKQIIDSVGIDVSTMDFEYFVKELDMNLGFLIAITYAFYASLHIEFPEDILEDIGKFYQIHFLENGNSRDVEDFVDMYRQVFIVS